MSLSPYTVTVITKEDAPYNVIPNAPIEIRARLSNGTSGGLSLIYSDQGGASPITQAGATADSNGQFVFYAEAAEYNAVYQSQTVPVDMGLTPSTLSSTLINELSQAYEFKTLEGNASSAVNFADIIVDKQITYKERTTGNAGSAIADVITIGTTAGVDLPDGKRIVASIAVPTLAFFIRKPDIFVLDVYGDGASNLDQAITHYKTVHVVGNKTLSAGIDVTEYCFISGDAWNNSVITATLTEDQAAFTTSNGFNFSGINLTSGNLLDGIGFSSGNKQVAFQSYSDASINGFKYGIWNRQSLWTSYKNLNLGGNLCGIRLARADYASDNSNPEAANNWNQSNGWFNNQLLVDNVLVDGSGGGEVGIWANGMGITFNSVTCQDIETDGTSNKILPNGQVGTGLIIDSGFSSAKDGWNNVVNNYYCENIGIGLQAKGQKNLTINGMFCQGKDVITKHAILADRSIITVNGLVGQERFSDGVINAIDESVVYVNDIVGPFVGTRFVADATSVIYPRGIADKNKLDFHVQGTGTPGEVFTLSEIVPEMGFTTLRFIGLNDGFDVRAGMANLYNWNNSSVSIVEWIGGAPPTGVIVAVSNSGVVTITYNSSQVLQARIQIEQEGGYGISTTGKTLTPI